MFVKPAVFVQWVDPGTDDADLIDQARGWTWVGAAEHALLRLASGSRVLIRGGRDGIQFLAKVEGPGRSLFVEIDGQEHRVDRIEWHTHPRVTGPSDGDLEALAILGQDESFIFEIGGDRDGTRITPKPYPPSG